MRWLFNRICLIHEDLRVTPSSLLASPYKAVSHRWRWPFWIWKAAPFYAFAYLKSRAPHRHQSILLPVSASPRKQAVYSLMGVVENPQYRHHRVPRTKPSSCSFSYSSTNPLPCLRSPFGILSKSMATSTLMCFRVSKPRREPMGILYATAQVE